MQAQHREIEQCARYRVCAMYPGGKRNHLPSPHHRNPQEQFLAAVHDRIELLPCSYTLHELCVCHSSPPDCFQGFETFVSIQAFLLGGIPGETWKTLSGVCRSSRCVGAQAVRGFDTSPVCRWLCYVKCASPALAARGARVPASGCRGLRRCQWNPQSGSAHGSETARAQDWEC